MCVVNLFFGVSLTSSQTNVSASVPSPQFRASELAQPITCFSKTHMVPKATREFALQ